MRTPDGQVTPVIAITLRPSQIRLCLILHLREVIHQLALIHPRTATDIANALQNREYEGATARTDDQADDGLDGATVHFVSLAFLAAIRLMLATLAQRVINSNATAVNANAGANRSRLPPIGTVTAAAIP